MSQASGILPRATGVENARRRTMPSDVRGEHRHTRVGSPLDSHRNESSMAHKPRRISQRPREDDLPSNTLCARLSGHQFSYCCLSWAPHGRDALGMLDPAVHVQLVRVVGSQPARAEVFPPDLAVDSQPGRAVAFRPDPEVGSRPDRAVVFRPDPEAGSRPDLGAGSRRVQEAGSQPAPVGAFQMAPILGGASLLRATLATTGPTATATTSKTRRRSCVGQNVGAHPYGCDDAPKARRGYLPPLRTIRASGASTSPPPVNGRHLLRGKKRLVLRTPGFMVGSLSPPQDAGGGPAAAARGRGAGSSAR